jgi:hypothetical protein
MSDWRRTDRAPTVSGVRHDELRDFALGAAERLPRLFPVLRPRGEPALTFAEEAAVELGEDDEHVPPDIVDRGLALLERGEARRIAHVFARLEPTGWRQLLADGGDRRDVEHAIAVGAVKLSICERRPRPRTLLAALEEGAELPPGGAVALVLEPSYLWSITDAMAVVARVPAPDADDDAWDAAARAVQVVPKQAARVRQLAAPLRRQLPVRSLRRASALLQTDVERLDADEDVARHASAILLLGAAAGLPRIHTALSLN